MIKGSWRGWVSQKNTFQSSRLVLATKGGSKICSPHANQTWIWEGYIDHTWCTTRLGFKWAGIGGAILVVACMGSLLVWSHSFILLFICYGVVQGIGHAFVYLPAVTCCSFFFKKRKSLATSLGFTGWKEGNHKMSWQRFQFYFKSYIGAGGGLGIVLVAIALSFTLSNFGVRGVFALVGLLTFFTIPATYFFIPTQEEMTAR